MVGCLEVGGTWLLEPRKRSVTMRIGVKRNREMVVAGGMLRLVSMISALCIADAANADDASARGKQVVEEWCRLCHLHAKDAADPDMAPPFENIVEREGRDEAYFVRFMQEDHFPITIFSIFRSR